MRGVSGVALPAQVGKRLGWCERVTVRARQGAPASVWQTWRPPFLGSPQADRPCPAGLVLSHSRWWSRKVALLSFWIPSIRPHTLQDSRLFHRLGSVLTCPLGGIEEAMSSGVPSPCSLCATSCKLAFEPLMSNLDRGKDQMLEGRDLTFHVSARAA